MAPDPQTLLPPVIDAVLAAGAQVAAEFARVGGPRFSDHITAPLDHEIEMMLRGRLLALVPARFVGEEAGILEAPENGYCWVVDPHDGTRAFLEGKRGSAVSVALLRRGQPILAAVYAPTSPDRGPDLITWAEGGPVQRNGQTVDIDLSERELTSDDVVFLNHGAWQRPVWHGQACAPAGFMPLPSIAYRLARIAVGDGIATLTLRPVNALDIAAGHALLMAAGGVLVTEDGETVSYDDMGHSRPSACFGGSPGAVAALRGRTWRGSQEPRREPRVTLTWPRTVPEAMLDRAAGCLFGLAIGGDLGPPVGRAVSFARSLVDGTVPGSPCDRLDSLVRAVIIGLRGAGDLLPDDSEAEALAFAIGAGVRGAGPEEIARLDPFAGAAPPAIARALLGVAHGRGVFPVPRVMRVLTWRPDAGLGIADPRPEMLWTDDLVDLAEALLS